MRKFSLAAKKIIDDSPQDNVPHRLPPRSQVPPQ
jgi:hypothetical protein